MNDKNLEFDIDTFQTLSLDNEEYGGIIYIQKIEKLFEENANIEYHVKLLKTDSVKFHIKERRLTKLLDVVDDPHSDIMQVHEVIDGIKKEISDNFSESKLLKGIELRKSWWQDYQQRKVVSMFIPTGISGLDKRLTEGLARQKCSVWSSRPGMGKTTTMANIALYLSRGVKDEENNYIVEPKKVLLVPLETGHMSYLDIMVSIIVKEKMTAELGNNQVAPGGTVGIPLDKMIRFANKIDSNEEKYIKMALSEIFENDNLVTTDDPEMTLNKLEIILEENNFDVVIIDLWEKLADVRIEASAIAEKLNKTQAIAKKCNTHIAIVQQIRRNPDQKGKIKKPTIELLKNSGGYEEVADLIVLMHREKYYNQELDDDIIEYIIGKQRRGVMNKSAHHMFDAPFGIIGPYVKAYVETNDSDVF